MRKTLLVLLICSIFLGINTQYTFANSPKPGAPCLKIGSTAIVVSKNASSKKYTCIKSSKKLVWNKGVILRSMSGPTQISTASQSEKPTPVIPIFPTPAPSPKPSSTPQIVALTIPSNPDPIDLQDIVKKAQSAISNPNNLLPVLDTTNAVSITQAPSNRPAEFVTGNSSKYFSYLGPTPLVETNPNRLGAVSLLTSDNRMVFKSQSALPPWAVSFTIKVVSENQSFSVATSGVGNGDPSAWRLVFKRDNGPWKYQSISGFSNPSDNVKRFDLVTFDAPGIYSIRLEFTWNTTFYGIGIASPENLLPVEEKSQLRVVILGDSFTNPALNESGPYHVWDAFPGALSWLSDWNIISAGVPGQGYLRNAAGEIYRDRIVRDLVPQNPDVVIFTGSPNDHCPTCSFTDEQIAAEMKRDVELLKSTDPHAIAIVCSPFVGFGNWTIYAMQAEISSLGVPFIDFVHLPLINQANNGSNQLINGHPTRLGSSYIATEILKAIASIKLM